MKAIQLLAAAALSAGLALNANAQCDATFSTSISGNTVAFSTNGNNASTAWMSWNFGDGNYSSGSSASHTYASPGTYVACFDVIDSTGSTCFDSYCDTIVIGNGGNGSGGSGSSSCDASFSWSYGSNSGDVSFNATGSGNAPNAYYYWNFGDGNTQTGTSASHTYSADGWYDACFHVIDSVGNCYQSSCDSIYIQGTGNGSGSSCDAQFVLLQDSTNAGLYYAWNNSTGSNLSYFWDFGDGNTSNQAYPTHVYSTVGTYTICLSIYNSTCADTVCQPINITVKANGTTLNVLQPGQVASVEEIQAISELEIFPNPNDGAFNIGLSSLENLEANVSLTNLVGQVVDTRIVSLVQGQNMIHFDTNIPSGIYMINVLNPENGSITSIKMMKK